MYCLSQQALRRAPYLWYKKVETHLSGVPSQVEGGGEFHIVQQKYFDLVISVYLGARG